jgi:hypothetical protein
MSKDSAHCPQSGWSGYWARFQPAYWRVSSVLSGSFWIYRRGAPGEIRTPDLLVRSQLLYPAELRARGFSLSQNRRQPMLLVLLCFAALNDAAQSERLCLGDAAHPIRHGEVWLIANRWGASPAVLVGTILNGILEQRTIQSWPQHWEQASDYRLLIGGSDSPLSPPSRNETDWGYGLDGPEDYTKRFQYFYLSPTFAKDWAGELNRIGPIVPRPVRRTIRFLNKDGKPLTGARIAVSVFGRTRIIAASRQGSKTAHSSRMPKDESRSRLRCRPS